MINNIISDHLVHQDILHDITNGFINHRSGEENFGYTQVFRNGCMEATKANLLIPSGEQLGIAGGKLEQQIFEVLPQYFRALRDIEVPPPLIILISFEGVLGANYHVRGNYYSDYEPPLPQNILRLPECFLEDYGEDVDFHRAVRPAFDALWNAIGYSKSKNFNEDGIWDGGQSTA